ncbi:MAG: hypothetical protein WDA22_01600 [Bacteroidota bacterium]
MSLENIRNQLKYIESPNYDIIFQNSVIYQIIEVLVGMSFTVYAFYIFTNTVHVFSIIVFCLFLSTVGIFIMIDGVRKICDRNPKIKLGKQGMWSEKYNFRSWDTIRCAKIRYVGRIYTLEIYLNGNSTNIPNEEVILNGIVGRSKIIDLINEYCEHNEKN